MDWLLIVGCVLLAVLAVLVLAAVRASRSQPAKRSEEHTSELQSQLLISYAVFCLNDTATTEIYTCVDTLSLHDALPICTASFTPLRGRLTGKTRPFRLSLNK